MKFKIFVINLKRCDEKRKKMEERLKGEEYEMFEAFDGRELNYEKLEQMGAGILKEWQDPFSGRNVTWGEVGCALSHYSVMEKCVQDNEEIAVILEDDVIIPTNFSTHINDCLENLNEIDDWEFCYLGRKSIDDKDVDYNEKFLKPGYSYWTCAYIINLKGMKKVIDAGTKKNLIASDEVLPIVGQSSPYNDYYKYYNLEEPLKMYSLKNVSCYPEHDAFSISDTENSKEIEVFNGELILLATGTEMTDGLKRFIKSCKTYGLKYEIMGLNTDWNGGDMANGPGGGQKINLLENELNKLNDEQIVLVTDSYDVIMCSNAKEIIDKYRSFDKNIVFATESICWPDKDIAHKFPSVINRQNLYLNSGGFIGDVKSIKHIISSVPSNSDDQRWYIQKFLSETGNKYMTLDYDCKIFQCLNNAETELDIKFNKSRLYNKYTETYPCHIHGNGGVSRKLKLNQYENYLSNNRTNIYGYNCKNDIELSKVKPNITVYVQFTGLNDITINIAKEFVNENIVAASMQIPNIDVIYSQASTINDGMEEAFAIDNVDYYWLVDCDFVITNKNTLVELICRNKGIITPMMAKPGLLWSNFWGEIDHNGWYKTSFDYKDIVGYDKKGCWNVPHISGNILINKEYIEKVQGFFTNNSGNHYYTEYMFFSHNCRKNNIFMYVTNLNEYGYIYDATKDNINDQVINKSLFMFDSYPDMWAKRYLHPDFYKAIDNWNDLPVEEPCEWTFKFPFVNERFCDELLNEVVERGQWSGGNGTKEKDERIGTVENVPTQDIHMTQIGFKEQWNNIVKKYIAQVVSHLYAPFKTNGINIAFVVKYEMGKQQQLVPHHDSSAYSINIALNTPGVDFEGGGTRFVKQDTVVHGKKGWAIIHPGRLTHYHEGLPITNGKRFIFVSFVN
jgi:GR25 family glycosyltransferase involved in LPS biosynthesis